MVKLIKHPALFLFLVIALVSCDKTKDRIDKPILVVTATEGLEGPAGKKMDFDIDATDADNITRVTVELQEGSGPVKMYEDSNINPAKTRVVFSTQYDLPVTAVKGDKFNFTFTAYDGAGNSTVASRTLTVSGSRPKIDISIPNDQVTSGQTVSFNVTFSDAGSDLKNFQWIEKVNGGAEKTLKDSTFAAGQRSITVPFSYQVPSGMSSGEFVVMLYKATNKDNVTWSETKRLTVQ